MDRDSFIISVYCLVVATYKTVKERYQLRHGGFPPALSDEEVITMEICGAYFKLHQDKDLFDYFHSHYRHFFPNLKDRTSFVRQAAIRPHTATIFFGMVGARSKNRQTRNPATATTNKMMMRSGFDKQNTIKG